MAKKKEKKIIQEGVVYINSTPNNLILSLCDVHGNMITWTSSGVLGFYGVKKKTPYAAQIVTEDFLKKLLFYSTKSIKLIITNLRDEINEIIVSTLKKYNIQIRTITNKTSVAYNGCRKPKVRRL